ncbi:MAG TPA: hypothetical protein VMM56_04745 [Planctomycetaceae bacterium]|nr:hypothetical protein [Planctomycetaceae bacterium]
MPIKFRCQHCRQLLGISQTKAGESVDCPTCGRAVRVPTLDGKSSPAPVPKMNLQDSSLLNALDALAGLGLGAAASPKIPAHSALGENSEDYSPIDAEQPGEAGSAAVNRDVSKVEDARELIPRPLPEPVELPPLEKPVALDEPSPFRERREVETIKPAAVGPQVPRDPLVELATLTNRPASRDDRVVVPAAGQNSFSTLAFVAGLSFLAGFLVHAQFFSSDDAHPEAESKTEAARRENSSNAEQGRSTTGPEIHKQENHRRAVEGRITYRTSEGNSKPDVGAIVILLPSSRSSSVKLPIVGFRPADHQEDRAVARASVRALGGEVCQVDEDGRFEAELEQSGNYHVFVLSHFQERSEEEIRLTESVRTVLLDYFDRPEQLPGRRRYHLGHVYYRGEATEIWDYSFERL